MRMGYVRKNGWKEGTKNNVRGKKKLYAAVGLKKNVQASTGLLVSSLSTGPVERQQQIADEFALNVRQLPRKAPLKQEK
jgi:hypothetical protein